MVTTSVVGKIGTPLRSSYAASKHALRFLTVFGQKNYQNNIAVTLVCPGFINTNISKNALTGNGTRKERWIQQREKECLRHIALN